MSGEQTEANAGIAVVIGSSGGIGKALVHVLQERRAFATVVGLSRSSEPPIDIEDETTIRDAASWVSRLGEVRLVIIATGVLQNGDVVAEKSWRQLDAAAMAKSFAVNAIGPALVTKHFLPLLPRQGRSVLAALSAKVGSIGDNRLGGWYSYRASKAALNQLVRTASIELSRSHGEAICVAIHPGTVDTSLSQPFVKTGLAVQQPIEAAKAIVDCLDRLTIADSGGFFDRTGERLAW